jgi:hypothetical protein
MEVNILIILFAVCSIVTFGRQAKLKRICVRFEVFTAVTMKNAVLRDIKTQFVPHRKLYVSLTETSHFILYKISGLRGGSYEEYGLLGYINPVPTS